MRDFSDHPACLEPCKQALPAVPGGLLAIGEAVAGEERIGTSGYTWKRDAEPAPRACVICSTVATGMPAPCPPYSPRHGTAKAD